MKSYNIVIVYKNGLSRSTNATRAENKAEAITKVLETDMDRELIVNLTIIENVREEF